MDQNEGNCSPIPKQTENINMNTTNNNRSSSYNNNNNNITSFDICSLIQAINESTNTTINSILNSSLQNGNQKKNKKFKEPLKDKKDFYEWWDKFTLHIELYECDEKEAIHMAKILVHLIDDINSLDALKVKIINKFGIIPPTLLDIAGIIQSNRESIDDYFRRFNNILDKIQIEENSRDGVMINFISQSQYREDLTLEIHGGWNPKDIIEILHKMKYYE